MKSNQRLFGLARKRCSILLAAVATFAVPRSLLAQGVDELGTYGDSQYRDDQESPDNFTLELRIGPYLPHVDSEFSEGVHPFQDYFGTKNRVAMGLEFDWLPFSIKNVLRFGPGAGVMYTTIGGKGKKHEDHTQNSGQATALRIFPHWAAAVLRVDALAKRTWIPVSFAAKLGLAESLWWASDEPRNRPARVSDAYGNSTMTDIVGRGRSYGLYYGIQVLVDLSFLEPTRRKRLDSFAGLNRIYFFGELYGLELNNFGASGAMNLSDRTWAVGMAFDL